MAGHIVHRSTKFEEPTPIHPSVTSSDISHRISLTASAFAATAHAPFHLTCHIFENPDTDLPIYYTSFVSLATMTFSGFYRGVCPMLKRFSGANFKVSSKSGQKMVVSC